MKVLHIISSSGMYGAEVVILNLVRELAFGPHRSALGVFCNSSNPSIELYEVALREGFESHLIACKGQIDRSAMADIRDLVGRTGADVVHTHGYKADIYSYFALRDTAMPLVSTCHTWYDTDLVVSIYGKIDRYVLRKFTRVVAVSNEVRKRLLKAGVSAEKIRLVRNGIDLRLYDGANASLRASAAVKSELMVGLVGRLAWEKGVDLFLEGMPMAVLEGMASGLALVATAVGEVPTVVEDGRTGILVPPGDAGQLSAAIIELLHNPEKRRRLGNAARHLIKEEYSATRMTADYLRVYQEAMASIQTRRSGPKSIATSKGGAR